MDLVLSQKLTQYFECLLDNPKEDKSISRTDRDNSVSVAVTECQSRKKKKKKLGKVKATNNKNENVPVNNESKGGKMTTNMKNNNIKDIHEGKSIKNRVSEDRGVAEDKGFTDDGFKIVSSIPQDDSDVSDAFESCSEEEEEAAAAVAAAAPTPCYRRERDTPSSRKPKETEDGFKIVTEIQPDDSDASDAFEDDEDDDSLSMSSSSHLHQHIKKPILQIMNDFGINDKAVIGKKENTLQPLKLSNKQKKLKNRPANTQTLAAKRKNQEDVQIIDYAKKRGVNKEKPKEEEEEVVLSSLESKPETLDEKQLKRVRYDVFRLGMSGFHKEKKEDARVSLAIKLGAKPPRNKVLNYKKLQKVKKEEKKVEAEEKEMKLKLGLKVPKPFKKKEKPVVKAAASQIGRYRHGVQVISKRDISKISKS